MGICYHLGMRSGFIVTLIVVLLFAGGYFYNLAQAVCPIPLSYRVGEIDDRFNLSLDEAKVAITEAAEVWESATGQNLFMYDDKADFTINFVYDERQQLIEEEENLRDRLDATENINDAFTETYDTLIADYNTLKDSYLSRVESYEQRLESYNDTVEQYNEDGGAPPDVYQELQDEQEELRNERIELDHVAEQLNVMVSEINDLGERGNALVASYNQNVGTFNERFGETREFTQGDYSKGHINIYTYKDETELQTVLAHELGHALSLDHVEGDSSVMYYLIGEQSADLHLSETDLAEFNRICGDMNLWDKIVYRLSSS